MNFREFKNIAGDVKTLLTGLGIYKHISAAAITNYNQIYALSKKISSAKRPAAIVCIGPGDFENEGFKRNAGVAIVIIDDFHADLEDKAFEVWDRLEATIDAFLPEFESNGTPVFKVGNGVYYKPSDFKPISMPDSKDSAYIFELDTEEIYKYQQGD